jgi:hypothetical protein
MSDTSSTTRLQYAAIGVIVLVHLAMVPIAITATLRAYGFEGGLTIRNQTTWKPIIGAQSSLLALYLGFGAGRSYLRGGLFCVGIAYVLMSVVWAYSKLCSFPSPVIENWIGQAKTASIWLVLPALVSGVALLPMRALLGSVQLEPSDAQNRFRIADILVITFIVAAVLAWYQFVMTDQLREVIDIRSLAVSTGFNIACAMGCLLCVLSRFWWWLGAIIFAVSIASIRTYWLSFPMAGFVTWALILYPWAIVTATLLGYRLIGYRLHRLTQVPNNHGMHSKHSVVRF